MSLKAPKTSYKKYKKKTILIATHTKKAIVITMEKTYCAAL